MAFAVVRQEQNLGGRRGLRNRQGVLQPCVYPGSGYLVLLSVEKTIK